MAAVSALAAGHWFACTVPAVMCAWCLRVFFKRQSQIRFSSANLKVRKRVGVGRVTFNISTFAAGARSRYSSMQE